MPRHRTPRQRLVADLVGQPTRDQVLCAIAEGVDTMQRIARDIGREPSTVRWHLAKLRKAGVIERHDARGFPRYVLATTDDARIAAAAAWVAKKGAAAALAALFANKGQPKEARMPALAAQMAERGLVKHAQSGNRETLILTWLGREVARALAP